ncbi:Elongator complex protein 4 [Vararia minispora EC-137]|uniref:Elongator complex protein 4 n=1 Tax=Vararia minispora EC-137 TaxID=1314806 RepID=A0ACB8QYQ6_9AGAM|nr:Elongator complex protein 4 [Vararia minispora EC-137]
MSAFKRRISSKQPPLPVGTRVSPASAATIITSTGIPSLDDVLGGGLPLSCSLLTLAPDPHSAYGELVQKYFVAQGLASGQRVVIVCHDARAFALECMWLSGPSVASADRDEDAQEGAGEKVKIAWRYENMKRVQTTVQSPSTDEFCRALDLTSRIPKAVVDDALKDGKLLCLDVPEMLDDPWKSIRDALNDADDAVPTRVCIPSLGAPGWGDLRPQDVLRLVYTLRAFLRAHPLACASVALPPHISDALWGGPGWLNKLAWLADGSITLTTFAGEPTLGALFGGAYHGLVRVHSLPGPHTLLAPSDRFSTLRGLGAGGVGGGENNLAFKCTRRRLAIETLHLDVEGGVGERRTKPAEGTAAGGARTKGAVEIVAERGGGGGGDGRAAVEVEMEGAERYGRKEMKGGETTEGAKTSTDRRKAKKSVAFRSERPDVYDF